MFDESKQSAHHYTSIDCMRGLSCKRLMSWQKMVADRVIRQKSVRDAAGLNTNTHSWGWLPARPRLPAANFFSVQ